MKKDNKLIPVSLIIALIIGGAAGYFLGNTSISSSFSGDSSSNNSKLAKNLNKIWSDNLIWTHNYIVAFVSGSPDSPDAARRILKNNEETANIFAEYYGNNIGIKFFNLLTRRSEIISDMVLSAKSGDNLKFNSGLKKLNENSKETAEFLNSINSVYFKKSEILNAVDDYNNSMVNLINARVKNNWDDYNFEFDKARDEALFIADKISNGINRHFPEK